MANYNCAQNHRGLGRSSRDVSTVQEPRATAVDSAEMLRREPQHLAAVRAESQEPPPPWSSPPRAKEKAPPPPSTEPSSRRAWRRWGEGAGEGGGPRAAGDEAPPEPPRVRRHGGHEKKPQSPHLYGHSLPHSLSETLPPRRPPLGRLGRSTLPPAFPSRPLLLLPAAAGALRRAKPGRIWRRRGALPSRRPWAVGGSSGRPVARAPSCGRRSSGSSGRRDWLVLTAAGRPIGGGCAQRDGRA